MRRKQLARVLTVSPGRPVRALLRAGRAHALDAGEAATARAARPARRGRAPQPELLLQAAQKPLGAGAVGAAEASGQTLRMTRGPARVSGNL
jgi:hypothetical protein